MRDGGNADFARPRFSLPPNFVFAKGEYAARLHFLIFGYSKTIVTKTFY